MTLPVPGARAYLPGSPSDVGVVKRAHEGSEASSVEMVWKGGRVTVVQVSELLPALAPGAEVEHAPPDPMADAYGHGTVEQCRTIADRHQVLVDFWRSQHRVWLPWEHLRPIRPLKHAFLRPSKLQGGDAETFRLRNLAYALDQWHANTGALTRLEIDPLPHQIHLVHRILTSGNLNWLIADDVGLGKTIEVGLLMSALMAKGRDRFLFVVPAGLTKQWKEELRDKFGVTDAMIYGDDIHIDHPEQWKMFDRVIVSMDRVKGEEHLRSFLQAERWDVVVVDEAHRLGRDEYGAKVSSTDRFIAAVQLRKRTDAMLLLTGTPHQGKDDRFRALLELLRPGPEWRRRFFHIRQEPELLADMVIRNRKADVTDADGAFVFRRKDVRTVEVPTSDDALAFDQALRQYVREGYAAGKRAGAKGFAIGFVMTVYRKLAASSHAAIATALANRLRRLTDGDGEAATSDADEDERYVEQEERRATADAPRTEFFRGEISMLEGLIAKAAVLEKDDRKLRWFLDEVVAPLCTEDANGKLLVFTEYRTTQAYVAEALRVRYGEASVALIHGGQSYVQRRASIDEFEADASFLISTEAGGEGLNLHRSCHVMVNYDLPWNPMRLVQRVGRLYRYGQTKRVQVINLHARDSLDQKVLGKMYQRLDTVAETMASVADYADGREGLEDDILGELVASLDVRDLLEGGDEDEERSEERLEEAMRRAKESAERQDEILRHASGYDPDALARDLPLGLEHLVAFAEGACERFGVQIAARRYDGTVWDLKLPERLQERLRSNQNVRIAFERSRAARLDGAEMFGPDHPLYQAFVEDLKAVDAGGRAASLVGLGGRAAIAALLRWTDAVGRPLYREYVGAIVRADGTFDVNAPDWAEFLLRPADDGPAPTPPGDDAWDAMVAGLDQELRRRSTATVHPDSPYRIGAAWLDGSSEKTEHQERARARPLDSGAVRIDATGVARPPGSIREDVT